MWGRTDRTVKARALRELRRWRLRCCCLAWLGIAFACPSAVAQDAPQTVAADEAPQKQQAAEVDREVSWRRMPKNFLQDQKDIWLFPRRFWWWDISGTIRTRNIPRCLPARHTPTAPSWTS